MASIGVIAAVSAGLLAVVRNQQVQAKKGAKTVARGLAAKYIQQKQDARNKNQAPDANALNKAKQRSVVDLQNRSGRASTFLSSELGG